jgi:low temperature requirement protein LtrA
MGTTNEPAGETAPGTQRDPVHPAFERPRLRSRDHGERRTTWLELFFDLVFVVAIDEVAQRLHGSVTTGAVGAYLVLLAPVWWAWVGYVYYTNRFGTDDLGDRLMTLAQMGAALALAAVAPDALEAKGSVAFALAYGLFRVLLVLRYAFAAWLADDGRQLARQFALGFGAAALVWLMSAAVPAPARFVLWAAGFAIDFATPFLARRQNAALPLDADHLQERFGNFTLVVLGVGTISTAESLRDHLWTPSALLAASLALLVGFAIWWIYFETLDGAPVEAFDEGHAGTYNLWVYSHLPLAAGIAASGLSVGGLIRGVDEAALDPAARMLFAGSVALCLAALALVNRAYAAADGGRWSSAQVRWALAASVVTSGVAIGGAGLSALAVAGVVAAACALPVVLDLRLRRRERRSRKAGNAGPRGASANTTGPAHR